MNVKKKKRILVLLSIILITCSFLRPRIEGKDAKAAGYVTVKFDCELGHVFGVADGGVPKNYIAFSSPTYSNIDVKKDEDQNIIEFKIPVAQKISFRVRVSAGKVTPVEINHRPCKETKSVMLGKEGEDEWFGGSIGENGQCFGYYCKNYKNVDILSVTFTLEPVVELVNPYGTGLTTLENTTFIGDATNSPTNNSLFSSAQVGDWQDQIIESSLTRTKEKLQDFQRLIRIATNAFLGVAVITSVIALILSLVRYAGAITHPRIRHEIRMEIVYGFICIALLGSIKLLTVLIISVAI